VILEYLQNNPDFLKPEAKMQELINFVQNMEDISISRSRTSLPWGIEVPDDPEHTMYVWFDALTNYIRVIGFDNDMKRFNDCWRGFRSAARTI
jgi:methionyl-tRNA synthetase